MEIALLSIRIFLFAIFALAAVGKLFDLRETENAVAAFGVPRRFSGLTATLLPIAELLIAFTFLSVGLSFWGAIAATFLLAIFSLAMLLQIRKGQEVDCHCFGQIVSGHVSHRTVLRNLVLMSLTIFLIVMGREWQGSDIFGSNGSTVQSLLLLFAAFGTVLLAFVLLMLKRVLERQTNVIRRIEELEAQRKWVTSGRMDATDPGAGLPVGTPIPDFKVKKLDGETVGMDEIFESDLPTLVLILGPECTPCEALMPEVRKWVTELGEKINFVFLTSGGAAANKSKFKSIGFERLYLQKDKEVSSLFSALWTPTAILVGKNRRIASRPAAGDKAIRLLVEQLRALDLEGDFTALLEGNKNKVGHLTPEFELEDLDGQKITPKHFETKPETLVVYWNTDCVYCVELKDKLREWDRQKRGDDLGLLVISSGDLEKNRSLGFASTVVIDNEDSVAGGFGLPGTPSAVRVNSDGRILSEPAVGARDLWKLIGR